MDEREGTQDLPGDDDWAKALHDASWLSGGPHEPSHHERSIEAEKRAAAVRAEQFEAQRRAGRAAAKRHRIEADGTKVRSAIIVLGLITLAIVAYFLNRPHSSQGAASSPSSSAATAGTLPGAGTCYSENLAGIVSCAGDHGPEVSGVVSLAASTSAYPASPSAWQQLLGDTCDQLGLRYVGGAYPRGISSGYLPVTRSAWDAGQKEVQCVVGKMGTGQTAWGSVTGTLHKG